MDTGKPTPHIHSETILIPPLLIENTVVEHALHLLNPHKGHGPDALHPVVLKAIVPLCARLLAELFKLSLASA